MASDISKGKNVFMVKVKQSKGLFLSSFTLKVVASLFLKCRQLCASRQGAKFQNSEIPETRRSWVALALQRN
jgi:hypothetical protein